MSYIRSMIKLCDDIIIPKKVQLQWLAAIALAKIGWFILFIVLRSDAWSLKTAAWGIALHPSESFGYFNPIEVYLRHGTYQGMCRMPGMIPFYLPFRLFMPQAHAQLILIIVQILFDILATWRLGILAGRIFQSLRATHFTWFLACISTFTVVRNNYLLSDSLCISLTILAVYDFSTFLIRRELKYLWLSAIGICLALFLRPVVLVLVPGLIILVLLAQGLTRSTLKAALVIALPTVLSLTAWTVRNKLTYDRYVVLVAPLGECQPQITPDFAAIRGWILASGGDYQPWAVGGESYWFFDSDQHLPMPFEKDDFTPGCDSTLLLSLKHDYHRLHSGLLSESDSLQLEKSIIDRGERIRESYIQTHPFRYHVLNKIKFTGMILFPHRIDDLPFPAFSEMNLIQKAIKVFSWLAIPAMSILSCLAICLWIFQRRWHLLLWMCLPMGLVFVHSYMGFVEQRYLASSYPFFMVLLAGLLAGIFASKKSKLPQL